MNGDDDAWFRGVLDAKLKIIERSMETMEQAVLALVVAHGFRVPRQRARQLLGIGAHTVDRGKYFRNLHLFGHLL